MTAGPDATPEVPGTPDDGAPHPPRRLQPTAVLWLTVVWVALWGDLSFANVLGGLVIAVVVLLAFPLPPVGIRLRIRPVALVLLALRFLRDVVVASLHVAWVTVQLRRLPRNAVVEVPLTTRSDLVLTVVAEMVSLVPGSLVVEARRSTHTLFLHVFDAQDTAGVERMRSSVLRLEQRVVHALGARAVPRPAPRPTSPEGSSS